MPRLGFGVQGAGPGLRRYGSHTLPSGEFIEMQR